LYNRSVGQQHTIGRCLERVGVAVAVVVLVLPNGV